MSTIPQVKQRRGYPTVDQDVLSIYFFDTKKLEKVDEGVSMLSQYSGIGPSGLSPDMYASIYHVYDKSTETGEVRILNHGSFQTKKIINLASGQTINTVVWSPDSRYALFAVETWVSDGDDSGGISTSSIKMYDSQSGAIKTLPANISSVRMFMDPMNVIVTMSGEFKVFNLSKFDIAEGQYEKSLGFLKEEHKTNDQHYLESDFVFSSNGAKVGFDRFVKQASATAADSTEIIYGDMNTKEYKVITPKGMFVGSFSISPDGSQVAYDMRNLASPKSKKDPEVRDIMIYDVRTGTTKRVGSGTPERWIDGTTLVSRIYLQDERRFVYTLINVETGGGEVMEGVR